MKNHSTIQKDYWRIERCFRRFQNFLRSSLTCVFLVPNKSGKIFVTFFSRFQHFLFCFTCFPELLCPLSPCAPPPDMVNYVVKNRFPKIWEAVHLFRGSGQSSIANSRKRSSFARLYLATPTLSSYFFRENCTAINKEYIV